MAAPPAAPEPWLSAAVLRLLGLWQPRTGGRSVGSLLAAGVSLGFPCWALSLSGLRLLMDRPQEVEELATCIFIPTMHGAMFIKSLYLVLRGPTLRELALLLSNMAAVNAPGGRGEQTRQRYRRLGDRVFLAMMATTAVTVVGWVCGPLVQQALSADSPGAPRSLPLPAWLPLDVFASPTYEALYLSQALFIALCSVATTSTDCFYIDLMLRIAAELEILNHSISDLGKKRASTAGSTQYKSADHFSGVEVHLQLSKNVKYHQDILRSIVLLEEAMSTSIFILFLVMMSGICASVLAAAAFLQNVGDLTRALKSILTLPSQLYDIAIYCIFGQIVTDQSETLVLSAYSSGWLEWDPRSRRALLTFSTMAARLLEVRVGKMYTLNRETLLQVLQGSYAMFNMFYGFKSNK